MEPVAPYMACYSTCFDCVPQGPDNRRSILHVLLACVGLCMRWCDSTCRLPILLLYAGCVEGKGSSEGSTV